MSSQKNNNLKLNKMTKLKNKIAKLDKIDLVGLLIGIFFLLPSIIMLVIDLINNGAKL